MILIFFGMAGNDVSTVVTPGVVVKVDYSTVASPLALPDARKPDLHSSEGITVK
ncbi:hypothetical protein Hanom_Chr04g00294131 [Helianthus anomalus]